MAKQNIYIGTKGGNDRIEKAIPRLMKTEGMKRDQATAVAIRLESIGRLGNQGGARKTPINPGAIAAALMTRNRQPKTTTEKVINRIETQSISQYKKRVKRTRTTKPKKR